MVLAPLMALLVWFTIRLAIMPDDSSCCTYEGSSSILRNISCRRRLMASKPTHAIK